jgi:hypothetical protein
MWLFVLSGLVLASALAPLGSQNFTKPNAVTPTSRTSVLILTTTSVRDLGSYRAPDLRDNQHRPADPRGHSVQNDFYAAPRAESRRAPRSHEPLLPARQVRQPPGRPRSADGEHDLPVTGRSLAPEGDSGYATGLVGKWHLGYKPEFSPGARRLDYFWGFKCGFVDYYQHTGGGGNPRSVKNGEPTHATECLTDLITERSVKFIEDHAGAPFFLGWPTTPRTGHFRSDKPSVAPGNARFVLPQDAETSTRRDYVSILGRAVRASARSWRALDRRGLSRNTIVIYTQDNGGQWLSRNAVLHRKGTVWERVMRVPLVVLLVAGPRPARRTTPQVGRLFDLLPALWRQLGPRCQPLPRLDGVDLLPVLEDVPSPARKAHAVLPQRAAGPGAARRAAGGLEGAGRRCGGDGVQPAAAPAGETASPRQDRTWPANCTRRSPSGRRTWTPVESPIQEPLGSRLTDQRSRTKMDLTVRQAPEAPGGSESRHYCPPRTATAGGPPGRRRGRGRHHQGRLHRSAGRRRPGRPAQDNGHA